MHQAIQINIVLARGHPVTPYPPTHHPPPFIRWQLISLSHYWRMISPLEIRLRNENIKILPYMCFGMQPKLISISYI